MLVDTVVRAGISAARYGLYTGGLYASLSELAICYCNRVQDVAGCPVDPLTA
jgi:hypothetical protein